MNITILACLSNYFSEKRTSCLCWEYGLQWKIMSSMVHMSTYMNNSMFFPGPVYFLLIILHKLINVRDLACQ